MGKGVSALLERNRIDSHCKVIRSICRMVYMDSLRQFCNQPIVVKEGSRTKLISVDEFDAQHLAGADEARPISMWPEVGPTATEDSRPGSAAVSVVLRGSPPTAFAIAPGAPTVRFAPRTPRAMLVGMGHAAMAATVALAAALGKVAAQAVTTPPVARLLPLGDLPAPSAYHSASNLPTREG